MTKVCLVLMCSSKGNIPGITYHRLGKSRYSLWLKAIGRNPIENISYNNVICSKHFEKSDFICKKGRTDIKKGAIPKHFLPRNVKFIREDEALQSPPVKKPRYILDTEMQPTESKIQGEASCSGFSSKNECISSSDSAGLKGSPKRNKRLIKKIHSYHTTEDLVRQKLNEQKQNIGMIRYERKKQIQKNKRLRKKVSHLQGIVSVIKRKNMLSPDACSLLEKSFSGIPLAVMKRMLANSREGRLTRKKYDKVMRSFAMTLHFYSSKAYEYVRKTFNLALPSQRVIRSWFSNINCEPGFSQPAFDSMKVKVSQNDSKGYATLCSLMLDEMSIKKHIDFHNGKSWGYVNLGTNLNEDDSTQYASEVLVLMVVALNGHWKLPIAYFLIHSLTAEEKANIVLEALIKLEECGVIITSLTCDGPNVNFSMMNHLGANVNNVSAIKPFFLHPVNGSKIFVVFDACHMVKIMRNNWATLVKFLDPDGEVVDFNYVKMLHEIQEKEGMRLGTKLKMAHMQWTKQKMKVNLAVQTLSESVASALEFLMVDLKDPCFREAGATIKFIRLVDKVFDLLNSRNPITVGMKMPIRRNNEDLWQPIFEEALNYFMNCKSLDSVKLINTTKKTPFKGFIITISSIIGIYENYVKPDDAKLNFLLTYKLSQDHLELFFCTVRSRNGWNNNPSAMQFYYTYKRLLLHHDIKNMNGNCIAQDATNVLYKTSSAKTEIPIEVNDIHILKKYGMEVQENVLVDHDYLMPITPSLSDISENVVAYVAGYAVKMTEKLLKCPTCIEALHQIDIRDKHLALLLRKKWGNLIVPSNDVIKVCREVEITLRKIFLLTDNKLPNEKNFSAVFIHKVSSRMFMNNNLFQCIHDHNNENLTLSENHISRLIKSLTTAYFKIRIYNLAKSQSYRAKGDLIRKKYSKLILFNNQ